MKKITVFKNLTKGQRVWIGAKTLIFPAIIILPYLLQKYQINEDDLMNPNNKALANGHPLFWMLSTLVLVIVFIITAFIAPKFKTAVENYAFKKAQLIASLLTLLATLPVYLVIRAHSQAVSIIEASYMNGKLVTISKPYFGIGFGPTAFVLLSLLFVFPNFYVWYMVGVNKKRTVGFKKKDLFR
jgi:magnesium-transporting ATPase (P-type)